MAKSTARLNYLTARRLPTEITRQAVIFVDLKGNIKSLNKYAEEILELPSTLAIEKNIEQVLPSTFFKKRLGKIKSKLYKGESWSGEFVLKRKNGTKFIAAIIDSPVLDKNNKVVGFTKIIEDITYRKREKEKNEFLIEASQELTRSLDYKATINTLSKLIVPFLADLFTIDVVDELGNIDLLIMAHSDPKKVSLGKRVREKYIVSGVIDSGLKTVIKTGKSIIYESISMEEVEKLAPDTKFVGFVKKFGFKSVMIVPLVSRGKVIGAMTLAATTFSNRTYDKTDLRFAESFARHVALALDNSALYLTAQKEIKERKITEESLVQLTSTLELSQQAGNIGSFDWSLSTNQIMWTSKLETLYGLGPGEFGGTLDEWISLVHKDDQKFVERSLKNCVKKKTPLNIQFRIVHPSGDVKWMQVKGEIFNDGIKQNLRLLGVQMDITRRKLLELDLQRSKDQLNIIFQNVADGISVQDAKGHLVYANNAAAAFSGYDNAEVMLKDYSKNNSTNVLRRYEKYAMKDETGKPFDYEQLPGRRALKGELNPEAIINYQDSISKKNKWVLIKARPIFDENDKVTFCVSIISDITERKIEERRKDDFLSMASHELKTPLTSIKAFVQVLKKKTEKSDDTESFAHLNKVDEQINKLTKLIGDLLDISKIQAGKIEYRMELFELDVLIDDLVDSVQRTSKTHKIIKSGVSNARVYGDQDRVGQIIINLLTNAIKYSPNSNKVYLRVSSAAKKVFIEIQDTGMGIPSEYHEMIFTRYFQVGDGRGLGLGLYISSQFAKHHGGEIKVTSKVGKGSIFTLVLPIA